MLQIDEDTIITLALAMKGYNTGITYNEILRLVDIINDLSNEIILINKENKSNDFLFLANKIYFKIIETKEIDYKVQNSINKLMSILKDNFNLSELDTLVCLKNIYLRFQEENLIKSNIR